MWWPVIPEDLGDVWEGSDDAVLSQLMQLQVTEGLPGTNDGNIWNGNNRKKKKRFRLWMDEPGDERWVNSPVPKPSIPGISSPKLRRRKTNKMSSFHAVPEPPKQRREAYPWIPFFGGLLLNWRVCLCLNLGGPLRGVAGPPLTRVADLISALGSRFILPVAFEAAPLGCGRGDLYIWEEKAFLK